MRLGFYPEERSEDAVPEPARGGPHTSHPCIIPTLEHYNFEPYQLETEWMEGFKNIVSAGVAIGLSPVIIGEVLKDLFCGIINRLQIAGLRGTTGQGLGCVSLSQAG